MRALLLVILGLAVGAMGATFALAALHQGTPFHSGVMAVMQHHMGALQAKVRAKQCDAKGSTDRLARMREAAGDLREAFPDMEPEFFRADDSLLEALDSAVAAGPETCAALIAALKPVGDACQSCHQHYR
ncbi:MAG TPA: cytochrome C [Luteibacter sp.]|uniref:cytochrome C n=1 Tax=Luteibacter sp. TaxID=1886636 RepID=UPI002BEF9297|nr:cytochrome C [Luteibacter sp.]HVI54328.1 cytochrome C [Luteibacter sp.]